MGKEKGEALIDDEIRGAEETGTGTGTGYILKLRKPFEWEGRKYTEIPFDWERLTGDDTLAIEREMSSQGLMLISPEFSGEFLVRVASRASGIGSDVLRRLPMYEFNQLRGHARSFLLGLEQ